jgi:tRNA (guanine-N7-)-methyltransferase
MMESQICAVEEAKPFRRPDIVKTRNLKVPNQYTLALQGELSAVAFDEERAPRQRGLWRSQVFAVPAATPVDVEIGTGNGVHFRSHCLAHPQRRLVGLELKFKPLIQTVRGMLRNRCENGRVCRSHAFNLDLLFEPGEVNDIFMHFPDPWTSPRKPKNRMVNPRMVELFFALQRPGSKFELKTDSQDFFLWAVSHFKESPYQCLLESHDWHGDPGSQQKVRTQFEKIFSDLGQPIYYGLWMKPNDAGLGYASTAEP